MKKQLALSLPNACSKDWSSFTSTHAGRMCATCQRVVVDFTSQSDDEILNYLDSRNEKICGRFKTSQLRTYPIILQPNVKPGLKLLIASLLTLMIALVAEPSLANPTSMDVNSRTIQLATENLEGAIFQSDFTIKGVVRDEDGIALAGVNIYLKGTNVGTISDGNGQFTFPQQLRGGDILVFSFIGLKMIEYKVPASEPQVIEIQMIMDEAIMMGEIVVEEVYSRQPRGVAKLWNKIRGVF